LGELDCASKKLGFNSQRLAAPIANSRRRSTLQALSLLMESGRRIAFPTAWDHANSALRFRRSNQKIAPGGMRFNDQFALQKLGAAHGRVGSFSTI
jgi:hypothetical protein